MKLMEERNRMLACMAAASLAAVALLTAGCAPQGGRSESETESGATTTVNVIESSWSAAKMEEPEQIDAMEIEGIQDTSLSEEDVRSLGPYLTRRLFKGEPLSGADLAIKEVPDYGEEGYRAFDVIERASGKEYTLLIGATWTFQEGRPQPEKAKASSSPSAEEQGEGEPARLADSSSEYDSSETEFDERHAWPLSKRDKVDPLIGEAVAARLFEDVNSYLASGGIKVAKEADLLVSEEGISQDGSIEEFDAMALVGVDRVVMHCTYDTSTLRHVIVWQP